MVCRYGGEEFVILYTSTTRDGAIKAAEKIRKEIENFKFNFNEEVPSGHITISIGFASSEEGEMEGDSILKLADERLYKAKSQGKNQVVFE